MKRPCLECGRPSDGSRCEWCGIRFDRMRNRQETLRRRAGMRAGRQHYDWEYRQRAAEVRAAATSCWLCGEGGRPDDPWTADHVTPGVRTSELRAAHRSCNSARANRMRAEKRKKRL